jgi:putative transposase
MGKANKTELAKSLGISRSLLYYKPKKPDKDWMLKQDIEKVLREFPSYGHKRLATHLKINRKKILRVMKLYGIKPYRRRGKKWRKSKKKECEPYENLLLASFPKHINHIWASDFTEIKWKDTIIYVATIIDLFSRRIVGYSIMTTHAKQLVINALINAASNHPIAQILHSDQGSEYLSKDYVDLAHYLGIRLSMSHAGSPWENGYQESFYSQFKIDLGDPNRFETLGEVVYEIYKTIHTYNKKRIHSALKMSPVQFSNQFLITDKVSNKRGT